MKIGIDISQLAYPQTGVANYLRELITQLIASDKENEYILFFSSLRGMLPQYPFMDHDRVTVKHWKLPPSVLDMLWNKLHRVSIERFIGDVDVFISSDWTEPPAKHAKKMTILYDLIVYKYPEETAAKIVATQKRKLAWVQKESTHILCISEATKHDATTILGIDANKCSVIYPGV